MMKVDLLRVSQDIDLTTGVSSYAAVLSLPAGQTIRASVSEEDAQALLRSVVRVAAPDEDSEIEDNDIDSEPEEQEDSQDFNNYYPEDSFVFGGQGGPVEDESATLPAPPIPRPVEPKLHPPRRRPIFVPKDEWGYPIIRDGSVDPGEIVSSVGALDEEGIGQG